MTATLATEGILIVETLDVVRFTLRFPLLADKPSVASCA